MIRLPPSATRTDTLFPYTSPCRSTWTICSLRPHGTEITVQRLRSSSIHFRDVNHGADHRPVAKHSAAVRQSPFADPFQRGYGTGIATFRSESGEEMPCK